MTDSKKKNLEESYERIINVGLCIVPYEDLSDIAAPEVMLFGTTKDEKLFSFRELDAMFKSQYEQMDGFVPSLDRKRLFTRTSYDGNNAIITEEVILTITSPEEVNTIFIRCSCIMEYIDNQWKLTHWHASTPVDTENDHWHMEEWKREKEKLQKLVDQQTADLHGKNRELKIEAALERIRAQATAMQESSDLLDIVVTMRTEFVNLGHEAHYFWHMRWLPEKYEKAMTSGDGKRIGMVMTLPRHIHGDIEPVAEWEKSDEPTHVLAMDVDTAVDYVDKMISLGDFEQVDPQAPTLDDIRHIGGLTFIMARTTHGEIGYSLPGVVPDPPKDAVNTLVRFAGVFDLAYKRFEDLKAAERQNREAQIELGLERVRARTMAMQSSEELADAASVLFEQVRALGGNLWGTGFGLCSENAESDEFWFANENGVFPAVSIPNTEDPAHKKMYEGWKKNVEFLALEEDGANLKIHYDYMMSLPDVRPFFQKILDEGLSFPEWQQWNAAYFTHGYLLIITLEPYPDPEILKRFARVFDQTYTRFLDLQKAEAQARESEIQLALERVRARSMAMQHSDELAEVSSLLFQQMKALGVDTYSSGFTIWDEEKGDLISWMCNADGSMNPPFRMPIVDDEWHKEQYESWQKGKDFIVKDLTGVELQSYFQYLRSFPLLEEAFKKSVTAGHPMPERQVHNVANFSHGNLLFITLEPVPDVHNIFMRFAKVLDQTYTRFLDLKKAEAQARESEIQLALERVRARSMAMHQSDELADLSLELVKQVHALGIDTWFCAFNIYDDHPEGSIEWGSNGQGTFPRYRTPREGVFLDYYEAGQRGEKLLVNEITEEECPAHYEYLCSLPGVGEQLLQMKDAGIPFPAYQIDHAAFFRYGYILFITFEPVPEAHDIFIRFAKVFQQTYTRFLDLQKSEEQAREAKIEAALERVRARSMGMHKSDDLIDVVREIGKGIHELGIQLHYSQIYTDYTYDPKTGLNIWVDVEGRDYLEKFHLPYIDHSITLNFLNALNEGLDYFSGRYSKAEKDSYFKLLFKYSDLKRIPKKRKELILNASGWTRFTVILNEATLNFGRYSLDEFTDEEHEIFIRFAKVFGQAYTRFLDLEKAEAQAREAEIEAALERVRSRSLAMHKPDELQDVVRVVAEELKNTGVILDTGGAVICTYFQDSRDVIHWTATDDPAHPSAPYLLPYFEDELFDEAWESKSRGDDYFAKVFSYDVKNAFFSHAFEHSDYRQLPDEYKKIILESKNHGLAWAWAENSAIMIPSIQGDLPSGEEKKTLIRFAKVFEQSFIRFLDLQKAEAQAREAQIEAALEKVRSRSLAMHKSDELNEVVKVLFEKMTELEVPSTAVGIQTFAESSKDMQCFVCGDVGTGIVISQYLLPYFDHPILEDYHNALEKELDLYVGTYSKKEKDSFYDVVLELPELKDLPAEVYSMIRESEEYKITMVPAKKSVLSVNDFHGNRLSEDQVNILKRFAKVFDQAYTRFLDLHKAEEQAREAKIETALEKIRSRTMGMQSSDELQEVANMLFLEVQALGIPAWSSGFNILAEDKKSAAAWMSSEGTLMEPFTLRLYGEASFDEMGDFLRRNEPFMVQELGGEALREHYKYMKTFPDLKPAFKKLEEQGLSLPTYQINHLCKFSHGFLLFITYEPVPESHDVFKRFTNVFDQTYTRFLDLKKAEKQARESRIEAALERVRSRAMAMQSSDELKEVANELRTQMGLLGQKDLEVCAIHLYDLHEDHFESWGAMHPPGSEGEILQSMALIPKSGSLIIDEMMDLYASKETDYILVNEGEKSKQWFDLMEEHVPEIFRHLTNIVADMPPDELKAYWALSEFSGGALLMVTYSFPDEDSRNLLRRTARVFGLAYKRFNDLKRAEAQAREAQIENALEKVRSRSLAMQHPDELVEVAQLLREEMGALGVEELETSSIYIHDDTSGLTQCWFTIKDSDDPGKSVTDQMTIDLQDTWVGRQMNQFYGSGQESTSILMKDDHRIEWIRYCEEKSDLFGKSEFYGESIPDRTYHLYKFSNGFLGAASPGEISDESWDLMRRATNVFSFAYTRFRDLQKAEESARQSRQQASLDRVRADISSMRSADDLDRITPLIWNELTTLGIPFIRCGIFIMHEDHELVEVYLSKPDGTSLAVMRLPFGSNELVTQTLNAWQQGSVYTQHWTREEFLEWGQSMMEQGQVPDLESYQGSKEAPESLHLQFLPFNQGMLYVGSINPLDDEEISLSESLAKAFSIAYARYEDFVKLEKAKTGIEEALTELKATQSQLVQQEKLASLGQLTAGIAHEIKNPLNFVNNFSELSVELVEEAREEVRREEVRLKAEDHGREKKSPLEGGSERSKQGDVRDSETETDSNLPNTPLNPLSKGEDESSPQFNLLLEILDDIETNLKTIHKHGSRADSIVKSMLQHSRGGDGKMEPTQLNPIIKEYVNLAFHGMRAGKDPINVDIDLNLDDSVGEVALVAEDFSRVILNLVNNAFDAMREKLSENAKGKSAKSPLEGGKDGEAVQGDDSSGEYVPKLTVRTLQKGDSVTIEIEDNGPGIPDEIKDKILQPFFTTKKGTAGTGLGLSITNDIIKAHGGELDIKSTGRVTIFSITLPRDS